jgi:hydrogenase assembly chaperone HypC/HupF
MCMSDAARVIEVRGEGEEAVVELRGARRLLSVGLLTLEGHSIEPGDWVLASAGIAMEKIEEEEAKELQDLMRAARGGIG